LQFEPITEQRLSDPRGNNGGKRNSSCS